MDISNLSRVFDSVPRFTENFIEVVNELCSDYGTLGKAKLFEEGSGVLISFDTELAGNSVQLGAVVFNVNGKVGIDCFIEKCSQEEFVRVYDSLKAVYHRFGLASSDIDGYKVACFVDGSHTSMSFYDGEIKKIYGGRFDLAKILKRYVEHFDEQKNIGIGTDYKFIVARATGSFYTGKVMSIEKLLNIINI